MDAATVKGRVEGAVNELRSLIDAALTTKSDGEEEKVDNIRAKADEAVKEVAAGFEDRQDPTTEPRPTKDTGATKAKEEDKAKATHK